MQSEYTLVLLALIGILPALLLAIRRAPKPEKEKEGSAQLVGHFGDISARIERLERNQERLEERVDMLMDRQRRD